MKNNPFKYSDDNKRYHTYNYHLRHKFGRKVYKVPLNVDLGCPNRDGSKGYGGCKFCSAKLSGDFAGNPEKDILTQYKQVRKIMENKWQNGLCIPYFQAGSNTYGDINLLEKMYKTAMGLENAVGLSIATRGDCIDEPKARLLGDIAKETYLTVELGLQTVHDKTAIAMNRCHTFEDFLRGYELLRKYNVNVMVHIINGLPNETHDMMMQTAEVLSRLDLMGVKIHLLHILKNTELAKMYLNGDFCEMEMTDYINIVCDQIEILPPEFVIARLTGDGARSELIAPKWSMNKKCVMNEIDKEFVRRNSYQSIHNAQLGEIQKREKSTK